MSVFLLLTFVAELIICIVYGKFYIRNLINFILGRGKVQGRIVGGFEATPRN